eukprot:CAMPEP_0172299032 /NCGR_PEP_ID=MMETSP1058-20130122/1415_1 /TAXON_ID=83371 /ORGANISM="Detonula confervacea, Strain CCMP 353" /LENGTH=301 /DNA_ID=CAMNT_0013008339 /DNA_START=22 /DNA_END=927 /DNA_ORIENTATION=-
MAMAVVPLASGSGHTPSNKIPNNRRPRTRRLSTRGSKSRRSKGSKNSGSHSKGSKKLFLEDESSSPYVTTRPGSKSSKVDSYYNMSEHKSSIEHNNKSSAAKSSKSNSESSKSGKAFEGAKAGKVEKAYAGNVNLFIDSSHVAIATYVPTPQPSIKEANQAEAIKTSIVENEYSTPKNTREPTSAPMAAQTLPANDFLAGPPPTSDTESSPDGSFEISDSILKGVEVETDSIPEGEEVEANSIPEGGEEQENPLTRSVYSDNEESDSSGFPVLGYVGIALGAAMAVGAGVIVKTEFQSSRA